MGRRRRSTIEGAAIRRWYAGGVLRPLLENRMRAHWLFLIGMIVALVGSILLVVFGLGAGQDAPV